MTLRELERLFEERQERKIGFEGACHDCRSDVKITAEVADDGRVSVDGGAVYQTAAGMFYKCDACFTKDHVLRNFRPVEVYSRVTGYLRPVDQWNKGKKAEYRTRTTFKADAA